MYLGFLMQCQPAKLRWRKVNIDMEKPLKIHNTQKISDQIHSSHEKPLVEKGKYTLGEASKYI